MLKKSDGFGIKLGSYMKYNQAEKIEIIKLVEQSDLGIRRTLVQMGISKSSFYEWYRRYLEDEYDGLCLKSKCPNQFLNCVPDRECKKVLNYALDRTWLSCREVAVEFTNKYGIIVTYDDIGLSYMTIGQHHRLINTSTEKI
jgi:putative transposase